MQLFINNVEVYTENPEDLYPNITYKSIDTYNPSAIKSNYSKTVKLPDCAVNNRLFNVPEEKYEWKLYDNGHVIERGYATLDSTTENYKTKYYNLTLYGQLGDFFYNLKGDEDNPKSLADLVYGWPSEATATYTWGPANIKACWDSDTPGTIAHTLKAIPCINSSASNFDRKKTIVYEGSTKEGYSGAGLFPSTSTAGNTCKVVGDVNYLLVESNEVTSFQRQDFRVDQMPVGVRYMDIINACCNPVNNGGYTVNLDTDFFNNNNPYWTNTYVLRRTPIMDYDFNSGTHTYTSWDYPTSSNYALQNQQYEFTPTAHSDDVFTVDADNKLTASEDIISGTYKVSVTPVIAVPASVFTAMGYNPNNIEAICTSRSSIMQVGVKMENDTPYTQGGMISTTVTSIIPTYSSSADYYNIATYLATDNNILYFQMNAIDLDLDIIEDATKIRTSILINTPEHLWFYSHAGIIHAWVRFGDDYYNDVKVYVEDPRQGVSHTLDSEMTVRFITGDETATYANPVYNKVDLLSSSNSPFDYLTAYTKMFNLRYYMHEDTKEIDILSYNKFIDGTNIVDIDDRIDFAKEYKFEPKIIDQGAIKFNLDHLPNDTVNEYTETINENIYDHEIKFRDREGTKTYVENNILKIGSTNRFTGDLNSRNPVGQSGTGPFGNVSFFGFNQADPYKLGYLNTDDEIVSENYNLNVVLGNSIYDFLDLSSDINDVMVMYSGEKSLSQGTCLLSSTSKEMIDYAGKPCYFSGWNANLSADTEVSICGSPCYILTSIPYFGLVPSTTSSLNALSYENLDFKSLRATSNIYDQYFDSFINRIYRDQKMITCYVRLDKPDLRKIYYFDKQYWILVEVSNYNFNSEPVKCKFVKYTP